MRYNGKELTEREAVRMAYGGGFRAATNLAANIAGAVESRNFRRVYNVGRDAFFLGSDLAAAGGYSSEGIVELARPITMSASKTPMENAAALVKGATLITGIIW